MLAALLLLLFPMYPGPHFFNVRTCTFGPKPVPTRAAGRFVGLPMPHHRSMGRMGHPGGCVRGGTDVRVRLHVASIEKGSGSSKPAV